MIQKRPSYSGKAFYFRSNDFKNLKELFQSGILEVVIIIALPCVTFDVIKILYGCRSSEAKNKKAARYFSGHVL